MIYRRREFGWEIVKLFSLRLSFTSRVRRATSELQLVMLPFGLYLSS